MSAEPSVALEPLEPTGLFAPSRAQLMRFEHEIAKLPAAEIPTVHTFPPHLYVRTVHIPAGTICTGKVHATEHIFILSKGSIALVTEEGRKHVQAPFQAVCRPGIKRAVYAHADSICSNVHLNPTNETDLAKLEAIFIEPEALPAPEPLKEIV